MRHTIQLTDDLEKRLDGLATQTGRTKQELLRESVAQLLERAERGGGLMPVRSTPGVMAGDACIRNTRIPVWLLVRYKRQSMSDGELLQSHPGLNVSHLAVAWDYFAANAQEVEAPRSSLRPKAVEPHRGIVVFTVDSRFAEIAARIDAALMEAEDCARPLIRVTRQDFRVE